MACCLAGWLAGRFRCHHGISPALLFSSLASPSLLFLSIARPTDRPTRRDPRPPLSARVFIWKCTRRRRKSAPLVLGYTLRFSRFHRACVATFFYSTLRRAQDWASGRGIKKTEQERAQRGGLDLPRAPWRGNDIRLWRSSSSPQSLGLGRKPLGGGVCARSCLSLRRLDAYSEALEPTWCPWNAGAVGTSLRTARARS